ncbi:sensor histidine kinase [Actinophytocola oryzae]|uniref:histidine kinase n=1 Tax=Actinophytocola oryzae TaxID=502181 RepID=A0A4R7V3Y2_9PSEU|nr:histidine kinase [Actinophytocola oryzae]TDV43610.1 histidine kinase [Actinophytocola oryzae]
MGRPLAVAAVLVANLAVFVAAAQANQGPFGMMTLLGYALLVWTAYLTGLTLPARTDLAVVVGTAFAAAAAQVAAHPAATPQHVSGFVVFTVLPVLVGRYLAQHRRLVRTLDAHNRALRTERALLAEREQLRERLRIARDMHDSLGRRLGLVSVQAAALEVGDLPARQSEAVAALARSARDAVTELYQLIGSLRGAAADGPGADRIPALVTEFRAAGVAVSVTGDPDAPLPVAVSRTAYRVVEEGLTNAAKHAPGRPVAIHLTRETDVLLVTVTNPVTAGPTAGGGYGLVGLAERAAAAGGFVDHRVENGEFRLVAMLPTATPDLPPVPRLTRTRLALLGVSTATLLFVLMPVSFVVGMGG